MTTALFSILAVAMVSAITMPSSPPAIPVTPTMVLTAAPAADWTTIDPADLLVLDLAAGGRVVIALADAFAPAHVANIRRLAQAGWFDRTAITRVQDDYVTQWGDPDDRPLPPGVVPHISSEFDRPAAGLVLSRFPYVDSYAATVGFVGGFPLAAAGSRAWLTHCYGMVGVGRGMNPDTGTGAELYAVIGHAPRALDRNIAVIGRVIAGMEHLTALPRGTGDLGFYADPKQRVPFARVRLAIDLPPAERPALQWLRPDSPSFRAWLKLRANRQDGFFLRPAHAVDLCNALPPVRPIAP